MDSSLYNIYSHLVSKDIVHDSIDNIFHIVVSKDYCWPNVCYANPNNKNICADDILRLIKRLNNLSISRHPFILLNEQEISSDIETVLTNNGLVPAAKWTNMTYDLSNNLVDFNQTNEIGNVKEVKTNDELNQWIDIVQDVLFEGESLDRDLFMKGINNHYFRLFLTCIHQAPASAALLYMSDTPCIYMVATRKDFRRKGLANVTIKAAHEAASASGARSVMLQSTKQGKALYKNIGYTEVNNVFLFMKKQ